MISKDDMNIEASNIQIKTIGAGYEKVGDSFIKINSISKLNLGSKDETTNIEEGRYSKTVDRGKMMGYQAGKAYATVSAGKYIGGNHPKAYGATHSPNLLFTNATIPYIPIMEGTLVEQFAVEQLVGSEIEGLNINPTIIDRVNIIDNSIFNMKPKTIEVDNKLELNLKVNNVLD